MCFRSQLLHKKWPVQLAFLLFIVCRIFLPYSVICCDLIIVCAECMNVKFSDTQQQ
jgi:hypothetical protein